MCPGKCIVLSTSKSVRKSMKSWDVSGSGRSWSVELVFRDLSGHLDFTRRARAGTVSKRVKGALHGAARFTVQSVRAVGQDVSPGKCVLLALPRLSGRA